MSVKKSVRFQLKAFLEPVVSAAFVTVVFGAYANLSLRSRFQELRRELLHATWYLVHTKYKLELLGSQGVVLKPNSVTSMIVML